MVDKIEASAKAADNTVVVEKGDNNHSLNLVDLKADTTSAKVFDTAGKGQTDNSMKAFPTIDLVDSDPQDSAKKAENRSSMGNKETPRFEGTGNWAPLEGYSLATGKNEAPTESLKDQNKNAINEKEKPRSEGTGNWAALENYTLATDKPVPPAETLKEQNRKSIDEKEKPRYEGARNW